MKWLLPAATNSRKAARSTRLLTLLSGRFRCAGERLGGIPERGPEPTRVAARAWPMRSAHPSTEDALSDIVTSAHPSTEDALSDIVSALAAAHVTIPPTSSAPHLYVRYLMSTSCVPHVYLRCTSGIPEVYLRCTSGVPQV